MRHDDAVETTKRHADDQKGAAHIGCPVYSSAHSAVSNLTGGIGTSWTIPKYVVKPEKRRIVRKLCKNCSYGLDNAVTWSVIHVKFWFLD